MPEWRWLDCLTGLWHASRWTESQVRHPATFVSEISPGIESQGGLADTARFAPSRWPGSTRADGWQAMRTLAVTLSTRADVWPKPSRIGVRVASQTTISPDRRSDRAVRVRSSSGRPWNCAKLGASSARDRIRGLPDNGRPRALTGTYPRMRRAGPRSRPATPCSTRRRRTGRSP